MECRIQFILVLELMLRLEMNLNPAFIIKTLIGALKNFSFTLQGNLPTQGVLINLEIQ